MSERFTKLDGGGITWYKDNETGLEWSETSPVQMTWEDSSKWCASVGGRMPTTKELLTLVDYSLWSPCTELLTPQSYYYWSASTYGPNPYFAWVVNFYDGFVDANLKSYDFYVRAVRGGKG